MAASAVTGAGVMLVRVRAGHSSGAVLPFQQVCLVLQKHHSSHKDKVKQCLEKTNRSKDTFFFILRSHVLLHTDKIDLKVGMYNLS